MTFDENELNMMFGDDPEIYEEIFSDFADTYKEMLEAVSVAVNDKNAEALQISAHTLKGVLATFCSTTAKDISFKLEEMGKDSIFDGVDELYSSLEKEVEALINELKSFSFKKAA
ncbi:MAG: hypothetical protein BM556_15985 [Bacteriovorax sp. MedPE-SWde]|nr:MAG: hypothetical protein BM556_15985 [Bacteriovorax sp. MedPE-SWde]